MLQMIGTIVVALIGLIGIIIQVIAKNKTESIDAKIDALRKESQKNDDDLNKRIDTFKYAMMKVWLVNEMTKIKDGIFIPNEEQKAVLKEVKKQYNAVGGNSYVNDMYDDLRKAGKF